MQRQQRLKADAEAAFQAALAAADPGPRVTAWLRENAQAGRPVGRLAIIAIGKAACAMAAAATAERSADPADVLVITKDGHAGQCPPGMGQVVETGHPTPDGRSLAAGEEALDRVKSLGAEDELLLLVSGGASALAEALPAGLPEADWFAANAALVNAGLPIQAINAVRKHCSRLKGGHLAAAAAPASVTALLLSDVIGDDPAVIGSGPAAADPSSYADALVAIDGIPDFPTAIRSHLQRGRDGDLQETPEAAELTHASNAVVGTNRMALEAAAQALEERGYRPWLMTSRLQGEASQVARALAAVGLEARHAGDPMTPPAAFLWGGETTVTLGSETGEGGRNQELALAMAPDLAGAAAIGALCAGTDGTDGPTEAAGAWVDGTTLRRAGDLGLSVVEALNSHDSGTLLHQLADRLVTGPTGTNVMDLALVLVAEDSDGG